MLPALSVSIEPIRPLDLLRMWHTKIEAWILEQAGIQQPAEKAAPISVAA